MSPSRLNLDLDTIRLEALVWGGSGIPTVICLHGYPDTAWTWRRVAPLLAERGYRVVAPFTRGYAPSAIPPDRDVTVGALVADVLDVAAFLDAPTTLLVGHDWGALTSNTIAALRDQPFAAIVSLAVPPLAEMRPTKDTMLPMLREFPGQIRNSWYIAVNQLPWLPERLLDPIVRRLWRDWSPRLDADEDLEYFARARIRPENRQAIVDYYRQMVRPRPKSQRHRELQMLFGAPIRHPILYAYGLEDGCLRPRLVEHLQKRLPPNSRVTALSQAGHFLQLDTPKELADAVSTYFADRGAAP
ncbi:alpha/beta hydrolase [Mycobacterium intracellulare]|uniref:alpha/beta fold hydrolase n=1 Tax=Mycobacterium intracellulare TaxID=1767 RepID=UPI003347DC9D